MPIAQINIARMLAPLESDEMLEFREFITPINVLAEAQPGFLWRLKDDEGTGATDVDHPFEDDMVIVNMSVWEDEATLRAFVFDTAHQYFVKSRRKWFERMRKPYFVMWDVAEGHEPTLAEAKDMLDLVAREGYGTVARTWGAPLTPPPPRPPAP